MKNKKDYKVMQPKKDGSITLSKKWLSEHLGVEEGDVIVQTKHKNGVFLMKFNPMEEIKKQLDSDE